MDGEGRNQIWAQVTHYGSCMEETGSRVRACCGKTRTTVYSFLFPLMVPTLRRALPGLPQRSVVSVNKSVVRKHPEFPGSETRYSTRKNSSPVIICVSVSTSPILLPPLQSVDMVADDDEHFFRKVRESLAICTHSESHLFFASLLSGGLWYTPLSTDCKERCKCSAHLERRPLVDG